MIGPRGKKCKIIICNKYGFTLCQQNGQRTYGGPPPNWGNRPAPSRDCEVFIGRLPRMCFEDELIPLFLTAGELYEFRLMLEYSGTNRGFGYAHYATLAGAQRAIETLNKYEIRPGHHIGVLKSKNNCRLLFGNISASLEASEFNDFIRTVTDQVLNVIMFKCFDQLKQTDFRISSEVEEAFLNRMPRNNEETQFAIVEYESHKAAAVARRVLIPKFGHVLAIDWAVPSREKRRSIGAGGPISSIERPLIRLSADSNVLLPFKLKARSVPFLLVQPSFFDHTFIPKVFKIVVKFFKFQLTVCLFKSVNKLEIPLFIGKEIERKILNRITHLENCNQAVQLMHNYFSWLNEKKHFVVNSEIQKILQEVKTFTNCMVFFLTKRLKQGSLEFSSDEHYYLNILPLHLSILFHIILRAEGKHQAKLCCGITDSLKWLVEILRKGNAKTREYIEEIINLIQNEEGRSLEMAGAVAKSVVWNTLILQSENEGNVMPADLPPKRNFSLRPSESMIESSNQINGNQMLVTPNEVALSKPISDLNVYLRGSGSQFIPIPYSQLERISGEQNADPNSFPPVQLLVVPPSIMNKVPFMPDIFNNIVVYFKHLIKICLNVCAWKMNIPHQICVEIEKKIIDRITNLENCCEGVQMILSYLAWWMERRPCSTNVEVCKVLQEIIVYADSFVNFVWSKSMSIYFPNDAIEDYFCKILPLRLNLLFQMMLIYNCENPLRLLVGIGKGLAWLEELIQSGGTNAKQFLDELTRFILEHDPIAYDRAKSLGKVYCTELMNYSGRLVAPMCEALSIPNVDIRGGDRNSPRWNFNNVTSSTLSISGSDTASDTNVEFDV